jgi:hypothetical protein
MSPKRPDPVEQIAMAQDAAPAPERKSGFQTNLRDTGAKRTGSGNLVGMQLRLTHEMWQALKRASLVEGKPQSELVREWIAPKLAEYTQE